MKPFLIAYYGMLIVVVFLALLQRFLLPENELLDLAKISSMFILLTIFFAAVAKSLVARLEILPEAKKFYDPDRMD